MPWLAKPFYWLAKGRIETWDPAFFGLLVANSILTASTAFMIILIGLRTGFSYVTSLVASMIFLFDWIVPNLNLSAYVDSGEAFFLTMVTWSLLSGRWFLLPVWAIPGSLSKETFGPFALVFSIIWWITDRPLRIARLVWILALAFLACGTVLFTFKNGGVFSGAMNYTVAMDQASAAGFIGALLRCLKAREFWYTFVWLLPLGLLRIRRLDKRWRLATAGTFLLALLFGAYNDALGNTTRALFNIAGPLLCLGVADFLTESKPRSA